MREARGNLWDAKDSDAIVITTNGTVKRNGACVMGRGCAREARDSIQGVDFTLGGYIARWGNRPFILCHAVGLDGYALVSMPVKHRYDEQADIRLIMRSAEQLVEMADKYHWQKVTLPRPGCGNGHLTWEEVKPVLESILDDRFTVITF